MTGYRERVPWPVWFYLAGGLVVAIVAVVALHADSWPAFAVVVATFLVLVYGLWRMRFVELEFGPFGAAFGFGGIGRRVPKERILGAEVAEYSPARYMGWGYRLGWERRERAYSVLGCPRGVVLRYEDERGRAWKVFLSSRNPEAAIAALGA